MINKINRKEIVKFMIGKWCLLIDNATLEQIVAISKTSNIDVVLEQQDIDMLKTKPGDQIKTIKKVISEIMPEVKPFNYSYEPPASLKLDDFAELYLLDQYQCLKKAYQILETKYAEN